jgi:hypothetical protein
MNGFERDVRVDEGFRMPADEMHFLRLGPSPGVRKSLKEETRGKRALSSFEAMEIWCFTVRV